ncbi:hypothetical protein [Mesorhizobium sp. ES1-3]|uniref:hypothetical protein n=1 Tax=Mesorhizobium sp. ES1-3 TaxID=2876628 RepID=UPI001CCEC070|nr:hypothetical protein [Mesorhizobium sp. ES1-3]MBZ9671637.1 hypothetical protein [Mesorhizobium sp. ES1-3]
MTGTALTDRPSENSLEPLIQALKRFSHFDPKMQVSTILTLLEVAEAENRGEPISVQDIEIRVGLKSGTASRNVYYWEEGHKDMRGGHNMVSIDFDPKDRRRRSLRLTAKGKAFVSSLLD